GIHEVHCFGFLRDPVDHCLSTFKHRAKMGTIPDFEGWLRTRYETMDVLSHFLGLVPQYKFHWVFRKYSQRSSFMAKAFFDQWLKVASPDLPSAARINSSLTLSEILFIQQLSMENSDAVPILYDKLIKLTSQ